MRVWSRTCKELNLHTVTGLRHFPAPQGGFSLEILNRTYKELNLHTVTGLRHLPAPQGGFSGEYGIVRAKRDLRPPPDSATGVYVITPTAVNQQGRWEL